MAAVGSNAVADFLTSAAEKPSGLVLEGEAGIGKTTLWLTAIEQARERGFRVLSAQPAEAESVLAYASLADLLGAVDPAGWRDLPEPQRRAIDQVLLRTESDAPATDQRAVAAAFLSAIGRLAQNSPVLLAIDDLQWLDPSSAHIVSFAVRRLTGPVGTLGAERIDPASETTAAWLRLARPDAVRRFQVQPLTLGGLHAMLSERLGRTFPRPTMSRIQQISGGNPFYAIELARALKDDTTLSEAALPGTLAGLVDARIGGLDDAVQEVLLAAACAAAPTVDLIAGAISTDAALVVRLLEEAEEHGIIEIAGRTVRFAHPLLAQGVYTRASPARRGRTHRRLAEVVAEPELQARHLALAATSGDPTTLASLDAAAEIARSRGAPAAAAALLDLAIGLGGDTPERRVRLADHHHDAGDIERAQILLEQTIEELSPGILRAKAFGQLGVLHMGAGGGNLLARDCFERALGEVGHHLAMRLQILITLSFLMPNIGDLAGGLRRAEQAVTHAERLGEPQLLSQALSTRVWLAVLNGAGVDEMSLQRALELEDRDAKADLFVRPSLHNVMILAWTGSLDEAIDVMATLHRRCLERGEETEVVAALFYIVVGEVWRGRFADAATAAEDAMERAMQLGGEQPLMWSLSVRASVYAHTGHIAEARRDVAEALVINQRSPSMLFAGWQLTTLGFLEVSLGNYEATLSALEPLVSMARAAPDATELFVAAFIPDAVEAFVGLGRHDQAEPLIAAGKQRRSS